MPAMKQKIQFCTAPDGVELAYAVSGDGPPLVMSPVWLTHLDAQWRSLAWQPWLEALSADYKLLRYDSRGCGLSDRDPENLSFEAWIRDFESVIDAAEFQQFSILAACQHGAVAIEYAATPIKLRPKMTGGCVPRLFNAVKYCGSTFSSLISKSSGWICFW